MTRTNNLPETSTEYTRDTEIDCPIYLYEGALEEYEDPADYVKFAPKGVRLG
ncbi:hypothetical protein [Alteribacter populi]|uniref:hypothetical protein n=1 Tax=Alteribacter populi TaxID=2011011 RepID=UPI0012FF9E6F|nr:hypothetical protein [Alteribacter populi]